MNRVGLGVGIYKILKNWCIEMDGNHVQNADMRSRRWEDVLMSLVFVPKFFNMNKFCVRDGPPRILIGNVFKTIKTPVLCN